MNERTAGRLGFAAAMAIVTLVGTTSTLHGQVPSRIPSDPENQILNLIQRVTALEEKLAALTNGSTPLRVKAPFVVVNASGQPMLEVKEVESYGGLALLDSRGEPRVALTSSGTIEVFDKAGQDFLTIAEDVSQADATFRIGGSEGGHSIRVKSGGGLAGLGTTTSGIGSLMVTDNQGEPRGFVGGQGAIGVFDEEGNDLIYIAEDISERPQAPIRIGGAEDEFVVEVSGKGSASLGTGPEGFGELSLTDEQNRTSGFRGWGRHAPDLRQSRPRHSQRGGGCHRRPGARDHRGREERIPGYGRLRERRGGTRGLRRLRDPSDPPG